MKGFTLIEILVVILIIGVLAGIAIPQYERAVSKAKTAKVATFLASLEKHIDLYHSVNGVCPTDVDDLDVTFVKNPIDPEITFCSKTKTGMTCLLLGQYEDICHYTLASLDGDIDNPGTLMCYVEGSKEEGEWIRFPMETDCDFF